MGFESVLVLCRSPQVYGIVSGWNAWNDALTYGCSRFTNLILMLCDRLSSFHRWRVQETLMTLKFASRARPLDLAWLARCGDAGRKQSSQGKDHHERCEAQDDRQSASSLEASSLCSCFSARHIFFRSLLYTFFFPEVYSFMCANLNLLTLHGLRGLRERL